MTKADAVAAALSAISSGQAQVLNDQLSSVYDAGNSNGGGGFTQADIDAARADEQAKSQAAVASVQAQLDKAQADDASDKAQVAAKQALLDQIDSLLHPAPPPAPPADVTSQPQ